MGLMNDIGRGSVGVDTVVFIYFIEEHPQFLPLIEPPFRAVDDGRMELITSALTLLEVLVVPYRTGDHLQPATTLFLRAVGASGSPTFRVTTCALPHNSELRLE